jgi:plastocyanin
LTRIFDRAATRRMRSWSALALLVGAAALGVGACGGDDDDENGEETAAQTATAPAGGGETVSISETDFALDPSDPTVKAGTVNFRVTNDGQTTHALEVEGPGGEAETDDIAPGQSAQLTVELNEAGTYEMYCPVGNHKEMGMEGEITVQ